MAEWWSGNPSEYYRFSEIALSKAMLIDRMCSDCIII